MHGYTKNQPATLTRLLLAFLFCASIAWLGYGVDRMQFPLLLLGYVPAFWVYAWLVWRLPDDWRFYVGVAVVARLLLFFAVPQLSDDVYRFIWDGRLWAAGVNPFAATPSAYADAGFPVAGLTPELYQLLNSPDYFTIYPPLPQLTFWLSAVISPNSLWGSMLIQRTFLLVAELSTVWLLPKMLRAWGLPAARTLIYAANPLLIVEITGNLHHEGLMVFFLALALYGLRQKKWVGGAVAYAASVASKLLPLMFLPLLWRRIGWKRGLFFYLLSGFFLVLLFAPLYNADFVRGFGESLDLYFRRFEFNGSIYYLLRWVGYQEKGYNLIQQIGPWLARLVAMGILLWSALERRPDWNNLFPALLAVICGYLFLATTVHPWYLGLPLFFCGFTRYRFPVLWSALIFGTYINYSYPEYQENLWVVVVEYVLVFAMLGYEWWIYKIRPTLFGSA